MLTKAEIEERLRINRHYEDVSALETAQQLYRERDEARGHATQYEQTASELRERLARAEKVVEAAQEMCAKEGEWVWKGLHDALAEWEGK